MGKAIQSAFLILFVVCFSKTATAQYMKIKGEVQDTSNFKPVRDASVVIIRLSDSVIVSNTRTDIYGKFSFDKLAIDTVEVLITHPKFNDLSYYIVGSKTQFEFNIDEIIVSDNFKSMNEVVIFASKDPVYYRGDTLVFVADSFDVKTNAVVEDLLKKLPGVEVAGDGGIKFQGKEVAKVLVDGDEFFGSDQLIATRNLDAKAVENVEIYEKEIENASDGSTETVQILNLKLKEDAKQGYFGRVAGGSDFNKFYEGEVLASRFVGKRKISAYLQTTNTPNSGFNWEDSQQYGLNNERQTIIDEEGDWSWFGSPSREGLPRSLRSGLFFQDQITEKLFTSLNYSYNDNNLVSNSDVSRQFFFADSSYAITDANRATNRKFNHTVNLNLQYQIDSFTTISIQPQFITTRTVQQANNTSLFLDNDRNLFTTSNMKNENESQESKFSNVSRITKQFKKKNRKLELTHQIDFEDNNSFGLINSKNTRASDSSQFSVFDQRKEGALRGIGHLARVVYWEPLSKFWRMELEYQLNYYETTNGAQSYNKVGQAYTELDSVFSNKFDNRQVVNMLGAFVRYDKGKHMVRIGTRVKKNETSNFNVYTGDRFLQDVNNLLPRVTYRFKPKPSLRLNLSYSTDAQLPNIGQLQPLQDNTNPNQISKGNAGLVPSYSQDLNLNFNNWNGLKSTYVYAGLYANQTNNAFSNSITFNADGQTVSETINVNGNYSGGFWGGFGVPLSGDIFTMRLNANADYRNTNNLINSQQNTTKNLATGGSMELIFEKNDTLYFELSAGSDYNRPRSTLGMGSNQPFWQHTFNLDFYYELPWKIRLESDANYNILTQRADGYNLNYFIWNVGISKRFLKEENLVLRFTANDILNQNTTISRNIMTNMIIDSRTQIINRFFLLKLTYNFKNKSKDKEKDETFN